MKNWKSYFKYWGKADLKYPNQPKWHPLVYHSLDVSACGQQLLIERHDWVNKLTSLSYLPKQEAIDWITFLLVIHDLGKFGDGFQNQRQDLLELLQGRSVSVGSNARHDTMGFELLMQYLPIWLGRDDFNSRGGALMRAWISAVAGHHGRPPRNDVSGALILRDNFPSFIIEDIKQFVTDAASFLLPGGCPLPKNTSLAENYKGTSWLLAGLAVAADWLGSNTKWFAYQEPNMNLADYWREVALPKAEITIVESGLVQAQPAVFNGFTNLFRYIEEPTPLQEWSQEVALSKTPQLFILEELTGGGKTEAAIILTSRLMAEERGSGVYIALPTMATADAMFDRIRKDGVYRRVFNDEQVSLALAHSADRLKFALEEANRKDSGYGGEEPVTASQHCTAWLADNRKKALLADFGIGTIDQALLSVLSAKHQPLRLLGLSTKVLVIDEVHACDAYMGELLEHLLSFHAKLGGSAILLSATLPQNQRERFMNAFASGLDCSVITPSKWEYPLATHWYQNVSTTEYEKPLKARKEVSRTVKIELIGDEEAVFVRFRNDAERGVCAVWIRNTVADALLAWRKWNTDYPDRKAILFHARFALIDRLRIGKTVEHTFGPDSIDKTRHAKLVIANQVIEQSLDVDFDDMVTDLVPIDLVLQRTGRLQRHVRDAKGNRLKKNESRDQRGSPVLGVFMPDPVLDASSNWYRKLLPKAAKVYPDHGKLWLTAHWLKKNGGFKLPEQAREMIEAVYGMDAEMNIPDGLIKTVTKVMGDQSADRSLAALNALNFGSGYQATSFHWNDDDNAPTRLGEATVRVRLARKTNDGLLPWADTKTGMEWPLSEVTIPKRMISGESPRYSSLLESARSNMKDEGRYCIIVPLKAKEFGQWQGYATNIDGDEMVVQYSPVTGLSVEKGVDDESD